MHLHHLKTTRLERTLWIELANPPANFLTADICAELHQVFKAAERDDSIAVLVLTGGLEDTFVFHFSIPELQKISADNRTFLLDRLCATRVGGKLMEWQAAFTLWLMDKLPITERAVLALTATLRGRCSTLYLWFQMMAAYFAIERSSKVTIAAINGHCNGGGTEMAACFDFRFMVGDAGYTIGQPEALVGIIAGGGGTQRLPRLIGKAKALEFLLTCDQWSAEQAKHNGLITEHYPMASFKEKVLAFAERMGRRSPIGMASTKHAVHAGQCVGLRQALAIEMTSTVRCFADRSTQAALVEYASILDEKIIHAPDRPGTMHDVAPLLESERLNRHFARR
jgi:enoyl-CoA hydratase/carnithine racemase